MKDCGTHWGKIFFIILLLLVSLSLSGGMIYQYYHYKKKREEDAVNYEIELDRIKNESVCPVQEPCPETNFTCPICPTQMNPTNIGDLPIEEYTQLTTKLNETGDIPGSRFIKIAKPSGDNYSITEIGIYDSNNKNIKNDKSIMFYVRGSVSGTTNILNNNSTADSSPLVMGTGQNGYIVIDLGSSMMLKKINIALDKSSFSSFNDAIVSVYDQYGSLLFNKKITNAQEITPIKFSV